MTNSISILAGSARRVNPLLLERAKSIRPGSPAWQAEIDHVARCHLKAVEKGDSELAEAALLLLLAVETLELIALQGAAQ
jgi:hypothetical protein